MDGTLWEGKRVERNSYEDGGGAGGRYCKEDLRGEGRQDSRERTLPSGERCVMRVAQAAHNM